MNFEHVTREYSLPEPRPRPRLLIAESDEAMRNAFTAAISELEFDVEVFEDAHQLLERCASLDVAPRTVLFDWSGPGPGGELVCAQIRARYAEPRVHIIASTGRPAGELDALMRGGVDDILLKPFSRRDVAARLCVAGQASGSADLQSLVEGFQLAQRHQNGELIVRGPGLSLKVLFAEGAICWVATDPELEHASQAIRVRLGLSPQDMTELVEECRRSRRSFDQVAIERDRVTRAQIDAVFQRHFRDLLERLRALNGPSAVFVPGQTSSATSLRFPPEKLAPWLYETRSAWNPKTEPLPTDYLKRCGRFVDMLSQVDNLVARFVLDTRTGASLVARGEVDLVEMAWSIARALGEAATAEEMMMTTPEHHVVARRVDGQRVAAVLVVHRQTNLGLVRHKLASALEAWRSSGKASQPPRLKKPPE